MRQLTHIPMGVYKWCNEIVHSQGRVELCKSYVRGSLLCEVNGQQDYWALNTAVTSLSHRTFQSVDLLQLFTKLSRAQTAEEDLQIEMFSDLMKWLLCSKLNNLVVQVLEGFRALQNSLGVTYVKTIYYIHTRWNTVWREIFADGSKNENSQIKFSWMLGQPWNPRKFPLYGVLSVTGQFTCKEKLFM